MQLVKELKIHMVYDGSYTMMAKPMKTLELHYPMIQFLIILLIIHQIFSLACTWSKYIK